MTMSEIVFNMACNGLAVLVLLLAALAVSRFRRRNLEARIRRTMAGSGWMTGSDVRDALGRPAGSVFPTLIRMVEAGELEREWRVVEVEDRPVPEGRTYRKGHFRLVNDPTNRED